LQKKTYVSAVLLIFALTATATNQTASHKFPPEVLKRKASIVGVKTTPDGGSVKVDGVTVPTIPFMLLKKDKPRVLRFELAGYKPVEKSFQNIKRMAAHWPSFLTDLYASFPNCKKASNLAFPSIIGSVKRTGSTGSQMLRPFRIC